MLILWLGTVQQVQRLQKKKGNPLQSWAGVAAVVGGGGSGTLSLLNRPLTRV